MNADIDWRQPHQSDQTWIAEFRALPLCVRPAAPSSQGEFAGYIRGLRVGFWDSPEAAKTKVAALALLPPSDTTRWTPRRKAEIVAAVRSGLISLDEACRRYNLTSDELAFWQHLFENHGVAALRVTRLHDYRSDEHDPDRTRLPAQQESALCWLVRNDGDRRRIAQGLLKERGGRGMPTATTPVGPAISERASTIARGLIRTKRAGSIIDMDQGMLRLGCRNGGYYWVSLDGSRVLRGEALFDADELQPKFGDAMERAGG